MIKEEYIDVENWLGSYLIKHKYEKMLMHELNEMIAERDNYIIQTDSVIKLMKTSGRNDTADTIETGKQEIISRYNALMDNFKEIIKSVQYERLDMIKAIDYAGSENDIIIAVTFKRYLEGKNWSIIGTEMQMNKSYCNKFKQHLFDRINERRGF